MTDTLRAGYRQALEPWCRFARAQLFKTAGPPATLCYGIGGHGHWAMQAHDTAFAAFAVLAADPETDPARTGMSRDEMTATAQAMLRFTLLSHRAGGGACTDGQPWGHSWISGLGVERMMHGVEALEPDLPRDLRELTRRVLVSEADWLLTEYPVEAGLVDHNKPESNLWNGALLHRAANMYPDAPHAANWREKGTTFLVNSISVPADEDSTALFGGKPLGERFVGANFFPSFACNHHGYLNVGYMVICLSNLAMFYFACRTRGWPVPPELERHACELWRLVAACTFPNGRLLRIGGDTRVRYCYCQDYAIPMWLYIQDRFGEPAAAAFEKGWFGQAKREQERNGDGSFLGERLGLLRDRSPNYYLRLEGDKAAAFSMGLYWRRTLPGFPAAPGIRPEPLAVRWEDDYHGAFFHRSGRRFASWVWEAAEKPQGLCLPPDAADWAEWKTNLAGRIQGVGRIQSARILRRTGAAFDGGFATAGTVAIKTQLFISEGDLDEEIAAIDLVYAALPDDATVVVLQRGRMLHRAYLSEWKSLMLQVLNDVQNGFERRLFWEGKEATLRGVPGKTETLQLDSRWINIENRMGAVILYGSESFVLHRSGGRQITIKEYLHMPRSSDGGGSVYAEEILLQADRGLKPWDAGAVLFDVGCALRCGETAAETKARMKPALPPILREGIRAVWVDGADGRRYLVAANLGETVETLAVPPDMARKLSHGQTGLTFTTPLPMEAGAVSVWRAG